MKISITWGGLELDESGAWNEAYLAGLRGELLDAEKRGEGCILEFRLDRESAPPWFRDRMASFFGDEALQTRFLEAAAHCKRRLKNREALEGWALTPAPGPGASAFTRRLTELFDNLTLSDS
ncbi:MAG: hypothetical protein LBG84_08235 [Treponema sp.]|jgi:hypothetical protein|nr:hypothetical protein [Treponema sp.]